MTSEEKYSELKRYLDLVLATIEYSISRQSKRFIADDEDYIQFHFERQKLEAVKYFNEKKLTGLKQKLKTWLKSIPEEDLAFEIFIKEKTGNDLGRFNELKKRVEIIVNQNKISNKKEMNDIITMINYYEEKSPGADEIEKLRKLAGNYLKNPRVVAGINRGEKSVVLNRKQEGDIMIERVVYFRGVKPKHVEFKEVIAPDGLRAAEVIQWQDKHRATTEIRITFPTTSGHIYIVEGIYPEINAYWKNNNILTIETPQECKATLQHLKVRSANDIIKIEYKYLTSE